MTWWPKGELFATQALWRKLGWESNLWSPMSSKQFNNSRYNSQPIFIAAENAGATQHDNWDTDQY